MSPDADGRDVDEAQRYAKSSIPDRHPYNGLRRFMRPGVRVLDVGCGSGDVGRLLAASGAVFDGVEVSRERAGVAAQHYRHVFVGPYETVEIDESYDIVLFLDVLEHLTDPSAAMRWAVERLGKDGAIVTLVPNAAHWTARVKIARGDWSYSDSGLFDRDHIHFYDIHTAREIGEAAGLEPTTCQYYAGQFPRWWRFRRQCLHRWPNLFALHVLTEWRA